MQNHVISEKKKELHLECCFYEETLYFAGEFFCQDFFKKA